MKYLCLIYSAEGAGPDPGDPNFGDLMAGYATFNEETKRQGVYVGGHALEDAATATSVRVRNSETVLTDGPFAETKEVLGGYYLLDCEDLDQALACAAKIPTATYGTIEVRPIMELPDID